MRKHRQWPRSEPEEVTQEVPVKHLVSAAVAALRATAAPEQERVLSFYGTPTGQAALLSYMAGVATVAWASGCSEPEVRQVTEQLVAAVERLCERAGRLGLASG
jgi:hypothetical protein